MAEQNGMRGKRVQWGLWKQSAARESPHHIFDPESRYLLASASSPPLQGSSTPVVVGRLSGSPIRLRTAR